MSGYRMDLNYRKILINKQIVEVYNFYWFLTVFCNINSLKIFLNVNEKL